MANWDDDSVAELRQALDQAEYYRTEALPAYSTRLLYPFHEIRQWFYGLESPLALAAYPERHYRPFAARYPLTYELFRLLFLHHTVPSQPKCPQAFWEETDDGYRALFQVTAIWGRYILSSIPGRTPGEFVYLGDDSATLGRLIRRACAPGSRALDLCCGCGVVGLTLPERYTDITGLDINEQAIEMARGNARLNQRPVTFAVSDLYQKADPPYDLVIGNPPSLPPDLAGAGRRFAVGDSQLTRAVLTGLTEVLAPDGLCLFMLFTRDSSFLDALDPRLSATFQIHQSYRLIGGEVLHHGCLTVRNDGQGQRSWRRPNWLERLRRWPFPFTQAAPNPQLCSLREAETSDQAFS